MRFSSLKFFLIGFTIVTAMTSCVPLAIGAAGAAAGYIARDAGVGVVEPASGSGGGSQSDYYSPPVYEDPSSYDTGGYDQPVY